jgi:hypothetical protein
LLPRWTYLVSRSPSNRSKVSHRHSDLPAHVGAGEELEAVDDHVVVGVINHLEQKMHTKISI